MSKYTGAQYKGAARDHRQMKRDQAEERNENAPAKLRLCGHVHGHEQRHRCNKES